MIRLEQKTHLDPEVFIVIKGYEYSRTKLWSYYFLCWLSLGILYLICRWFPKWKVSLIAYPASFETAAFLLLENNWNQIYIVDINTVPFNGTNACFEEELVEPLSFIKTFDFQYHFFILNPKSKLWCNNSSLKGFWKIARKDVLNGISKEQFETRQVILGKNSIEIKQKPVLNLLMDEVLHPFYVFQIASIILWSFDDYYYYASCIFLISTTSAISTLVDTMRTMKRMREMSFFICEVKVWRSDVWSTIPSDELVPGDVFEVTPGVLHTFPCDAVLLDGECIVNESMLTGESIPVSKNPISDDELSKLDFEENDPARSSEMSRYFLFSGTKVIRVRPGKKTKVLPMMQRDEDGVAGGLALVVRTGFNTTKGSLISSMLFPRPNKFKFYRDAFRFIGIMGIVALLGFFASFYYFILLKVHWTSIVLRALDLITIVVPPALPATMAIGTGFAISRLKEKGIFCISPPRLNICGKLDVICFDKTGTLTEDGLDVMGFRYTLNEETLRFSPCSTTTDERPISPALSESAVEHLYSHPNEKLQKVVFSDLQRTVEHSFVVPNKEVDSFGMAKSSSIDILNSSQRELSSTSLYYEASSSYPELSEIEATCPYPLIVCAMATCHSIKIVQGELLGDPMDLKMFEATGWLIEEDGGYHSRATSSTFNLGSNINKKKKSNTASGVITSVVRPPGDADIQEVLIESALDQNKGKNVATSINSSTIKNLLLGTLAKPNDYDHVEKTSSILTKKEPIESQSKINTEFGVVKSFEFVSHLRRMSVIVRRIHYSVNSFSAADESGLGDSFIQFGNSLSTSFSVNGSVTANNGNGRDFEVFVKGAPEVIYPICLPESIPADYFQLLKDYAHHGYRVLAVAYKRISNLSYVKLNKIKRDEVETELYFLGFIIFENKLKGGSAYVVKTLNEASIRQIMCTGDNVLTAISVSRECGLVNPNNVIYSPKFLPGYTSHDPHAQIKFEDVDERGLFLNPNSLLPGRSQDDNSVTDIVGHHPSIPQLHQYDLAVTGELFQYMMDHSPTEVFNRMLIKGQIFARMSPDQKHLLVERLQELGYCVGFVGDGANDCGALKAADVGLSLSESEASVAAPFTSLSVNLDCVPRLIREGRAALVTSFSCFKYMALYSLIQFTSVTLLYSLGGNLGDFQFLFIDLAVIVPVATTMARSGPYSKLDPKRPTASLVSKRVLTSLFGQVIIQVVGQFWLFYWIKQQKWYQKPDTNVDDRKFKCFENTAVFLLSCYQYLLVAIAFSVGKPYRQSMWKNGYFMLTVTVLAAIILFINVYPTEWVSDFLDLLIIPMEGRMYILFIAITNCLASWFGEKFVFHRVSNFIGYLFLAKGEIKQRVVVNDEERNLLGSRVNGFKNEAKKEKWKSKGKLFKVIRCEMDEDEKNNYR